MMELSKPLQDEIFKIQNDLKAAIQNHQILVLRQKTHPVDLDIKTQLTEVQKHIRSLGETQKILVTRVRNELAAKKLLRINNNNNHSERNDYTNLKKSSLKDNRSLLKSNTEHVNRSLLKHRSITVDKGRLGPQKNGEHNKESPIFKNNNEPHNKDRSLLMQNVDYGRSLLKAKSDRKEKRYSPNKVKEESIIQDSSSEENKTPRSSPKNLGESPRKSAVKHESNQDLDSNWDLEEEAVPAKRSKATLQATPRPSSPVQPYKSHKISDSVSNSSEESVDNVFSTPYTDNKENFMLSLGLITNENMLKLKSKKTERRRRRRKCSAQHHWYSSLWDLTVLQKRNHNKYLSESRSSPTRDMKMEEYDDIIRDDDSQDSTDSISNKPRVCFICRKSGDVPLVDCNSCPTTFHTSCTTDAIPGLCPTCSQVGGNAEIASSNSVSSTEVVARYIQKTDSNYAERLTEKQRLLKKNTSLKEELAELEEKAKDLSVSLVNRVTTVNQLTASEEKVRSAIKKVIDFVTAIQKPELTTPSTDS